MNRLLAERTRLDRRLTARHEQRQAAERDAQHHCFAKAQGTLMVHVTLCSNSARSPLTHGVSS